MKLFFLLFIASLQCVAQDTVRVHIAHGSKPRKEYKEEYKTIGGFKGGHVVIEIDKLCYGFYFKENSIHLFPHNKTKNGVFQKQTLNEWNAIVKDKKVTTVYIPVSIIEKQKLLAYYATNLKKPSCDYAFLGERCASNSYHQLKSIGKIQGGGYCFNAFYPAQLLRTILKQNTLFNYKISLKQGSVKRKWEGDKL